MGERAVLVEGVGDPAAWALGVRAAGFAGVVDVVPAAETVLVSCESAEAVRNVAARLTTVVPGSTVADGGFVDIAVRYDGADLAEVAAATGLTPDEVVAQHSGAEYSAAFCGFSPGFAYLAGLPESLHLPRRATPRTRVPRGAVAIASGYSAVYPRPSPGGWHLLGTTDVDVWDADRDPPAMLVPGTRVRFVAR